MSMNNPFEKLNIKRDEEEEDDGQGEFQKVKGKDKNLPVGIDSKKKKTRPKEKVEANDEEGFEEVGKTKKKRPANDDEEDELKGGEHKKRREIDYNKEEVRNYRGRDKPKRGRQFDRQSGTGRGKEIAKGGAGGKGTWGENPKKIARDYENNDDDYYFENALNPEKKKERQPKKPRKEDKKEGEEGEEKKEGEGESKENEEDNKKKRERDNKPKYELKEEEKLNRPKDAKTLEEYLKEKEKPSEEIKEVKRIKDGKPLEKKQEKNDDYLATTGQGRKKGKKKKIKEINKDEVDLNNLIGANLQIGGGEMMGRRPRKQDYRKGKKGEEKFVFKEEDFPEL